MVTDPVCGIDVEETPSPLTTEYGGRTYYFCSETCREEFEANPQRFALEVGVSPPP